MAEQTKAELLTAAQEIKNEVDAGENTATRVGGHLENVVDSMFQGPFRGSHATNNAFPSTGGRFTSGQPAEGDFWYATVDVTVGGNFYPTGTVFMAITDNPGQTLTNWLKFAMQL